MLLKEIVEALKLKVVTGAGKLDEVVTGGYSGDLLSDVISNAEAGNVWITMQVHQNISAVAVLKNITAIILVNNREPLPETLAKAERENVVILKSPMSAFETTGRLYALGIRG